MKLRSRGLHAAPTFQCCWRRTRPVLQQAQAARNGAQRACVASSPRWTCWLYPVDFCMDRKGQCKEFGRYLPMLFRPTMRRPRWLLWGRVLPCCLRWLRPARPYPTDAWSGFSACAGQHMVAVGELDNEAKLLNARLAQSMCRAHAATCATPLICKSAHNAACL